MRRFDFFLFDIDENDIFPDLDDVFPWDNEFAFSPEHGEKSAWSRNNQTHNTASLRIDIDIGHAAERAAGTNIDDFFLTQITDTHRFSSAA